MSTPIFIISLPILLDPSADLDSLESTTSDSEKVCTSFELDMKHEAHTQEAGSETSTSSGADIRMQRNKNVQQVISMLQNPLILYRSAKKMIEM